MIRGGIQHTKLLISNNTMYHSSNQLECPILIHLPWSNIQVGQTRVAQGDLMRHQPHKRQGLKFKDNSSRNNITGCFISYLKLGNIASDKGLLLRHMILYHLGNQTLCQSPQAFYQASTQHTSHMNQISYKQFHYIYRTHICYQFLSDLITVACQSEIYQKTSLAYEFNKPAQPIRIKIQEYQQYLISRVSIALMQTTNR